MGGRSRRVEPPVGLVVERFEVDGEELAVFSWGSERAEPGALSEAEREVLAAITRGATNAEIAAARRTSARTVANQVASILRKTGARSRYDLTRRFAGVRGDS